MSALGLQAVCKRARAENAQNCFLSFLLSTVTARAVLFLFNVIETNFLRASPTSEFSHSLDPYRTFACKSQAVRIWRRRRTSTLPQPFQPALRKPTTR